MKQTGIKKTVFVLLIMFLLCPSAVFGAESVYQIDAMEPEDPALWQAGTLTGFGGTAVMEGKGASGAAGTWEIETQPGAYYVSWWNAISDAGCPAATLTLKSAEIEQKYELPQNQGVSGWLELGMIQLSDGKLTVHIAGTSGKVLASAVRLNIIDGYEAMTALMFQRNPNLAAMKINSPVLFQNSRKIQVQPPVLIEDTTWVPLRILSEGLGYSVEWDGQHQKIFMQSGDTTLLFTIGSSEYTKNGETYEMPFAPFLQEDITMVPLRLVSESMGQLVFWHESGMILVGDEVPFDTETDAKFLDTLQMAFS